MKRICRVLLLLPLTIGCAEQSSDVAIPVATRIAQLENNILPAVDDTEAAVVPQTLAARMAHHGVPGLSVAVIENGALSWARGYGFADVEAGRAVTPATLFQAASVSKPVAAFGALRLVQGGILSLDEDVNRRLVSWQVPDNEFTTTEKVTLRRLLNHTAGTTVWGFPGYVEEGIPTTVEVLDGKGNTDPITVYKTPGEGWQYSGGGYTIIEVLMGDVAGQPFAGLMRELILEPAGMLHSRYQHPLAPAFHGQAAVGYGEDGERVAEGWHHYSALAAAGLWTTPTDIATFAMKIQQAFAGSRDRMLNRALVQVMLSPGENNWGLGPVISEDKLRFGHGGSNQGYRCGFSAAIHDGDGIVVMTNSDNGGPLIQEIMTSAGRIYGWRGM